MTPLITTHEPPSVVRARRQKLWLPMESMTHCRASNEDGEEQLKVDDGVSGADASELNCGFVNSRCHVRATWNTRACCD
ncbi:hypothetical protein AK812_SmicGene8009 [Symbiodinium microadriaticum]|uniref:Uncharacterized protein n=1 Tax=Symbiodinium microadriaticum TaxID=2951 RepID=A0A1Q9ELY6_SYMMI|nr:hypothetical protein AK812_SmicGene8009 [Symbiodinium microadriaticum]